MFSKKNTPEVRVFLSS